MEKNLLFLQEQLRKGIIGYLHKDNFPKTMAVGTFIHTYSLLLYTYVLSPSTPTLLHQREREREMASDHHSMLVLVVLTIILVPSGMY